MQGVLYSFLSLITLTTSTNQKTVALRSILLIDESIYSHNSVDLKLAKKRYKAQIHWNSSNMLQNPISEFKLTNFKTNLTSFFKVFLVQTIAPEIIFFAHFSRCGCQMTS